MPPLPAPITRIAIYAKDMEKTLLFYQKFFGFKVIANESDQLIELQNPGGGSGLVILPASKGHRAGQSCVKIVFDVKDVAAFRSAKLKQGLKFGAIHECDGYQYCNARDPGQNPIQISSRAYRSPGSQ
ncbi:MAG: VOC family protein [Planctomycetales bacterium]|nr:VOC family protein [Planctomycetales bacterium]